jgi:hypothetical protein
VREPSAITRIRRRYRVVAPELDERRRRQWAAAVAREAGYGGVTLVARATGLARSTIHVGLRDLQTSMRQRVVAAERIRRAGAGRPPVVTSDPELLTALLALIEPTTRGHPELQTWACPRPHSGRSRQLGRSRPATPAASARNRFQLSPVGPGPRSPRTATAR